MLLFSFVLVSLALVSWVGFAAVAVESGHYTEAPGSPFEEGHEPHSDDDLVERAFTPVGLVLVACVVGLPAVFFIALAAAWHRFVLKPLDEESDPSRLLDRCKLGD